MLSMGANYFYDIELLTLPIDFCGVFTRMREFVDGIPGK